MDLTIELFGNLTLTFLAFVLPIVGVLLSVFHEGINILTAQYENEKQQTEANIKNQLKGIGNAKSEFKETEIRTNLNKLERIKKEAERKLLALDPKKQVLKLFIPLALAFLGTEFASLDIDQKIEIAKNTTIQLTYIAFFFAWIVFLFALNRLWILSGVIIEIKKASDEVKNKSDRESREALFSLLKKIKTTGNQYFLNKVYIAINGEKIGEKKLEILMTTQEKTELKISIINSEPRMAKNVEIGLIFPADFIIERTGSYAIYTDETSQIVRYETAMIQGDTNLVLKPLMITPLKKDDTKIRTFIKAENIEVRSGEFFLKIT